MLTKMEFHDCRRQMRELLVAHYVGEGCLEGAKIEEWLLEYGGWFPDPQEFYGDGTPWTQPHDQGADAPCGNPGQAICDAEWLLNLNGGLTSAREEVGQSREGQTLSGCPEEGDSSDAESNQVISSTSGPAPDF